MAPAIRSETFSSDIEECVQSKRLYHSNSYHTVSTEEKHNIQHDLLQWYQAEKRTNMPWRKPTDKNWDQEVSIYFIKITVLELFD